MKEKIIDCYGMDASKVEELIWEYTDKNYGFAYSTFGNPTFVKYGRDGEVLDSVCFIYPYVGLRFNRA